MPLPTEGILFSSSFPAPDPGNQLVLPRTNGGTPAQYVTFQPQAATANLLGVGRPDGVTLQVDANGVWSVVAGSGGIGSGGISASGGATVCVIPAPDPTDGTRTQWILPAPVLAGTDYWLNRNDAVQRQIGPMAYYSVQGTQLTLVYPLEADGYLEFHYVMGTPDSESGGSGNVNPIGSALVRNTSTGWGATGGNSFSVAFPSGTLAGDLVVICANSDWDLAVPSGWTSNSLSNGGTWNLLVCSKIMTSGDIAAGSVTVTSGGNNDFAYIATAFIGPAGGVRESDPVTNHLSPTIITTSSAVAATDSALYFASVRGAGSTVSISNGVAKTSVTGTNSQSNLNTEALSVAGAYSVTFTYTSGGAGESFAVVIVKAF